MRLRLWHVPQLRAALGLELQNHGLELEARLLRGEGALEELRVPGVSALSGAELRAVLNRLSKALQALVALLEPPTGFFKPL